MKKINLILAIILIVFIGISVFYIKQQATKNKPITYPFFVSTRYITTNVRTGPDTSYPLILTYHTLNYPLKVIDSYNSWYNVKDLRGRTGWVSSLLVKKNQAAIVIHPNTTIHVSNNASSKVVAILDKNNIVNLKKCNNLSLMCEVSIKIPKRRFTIKGWIQRSNVWGGGVDHSY